MYKVLICRLFEPCKILEKNNNPKKLLRINSQNIFQVKYQKYSPS